ncbi:hypothetical protein IFM89_035453 [Coptis chinensis]|uniref:OB domain-containing protein n=1 Tax=Coptis chinensis TaxID=261450 RepID=A0A835IZU9_9MAGN|nr:hypothetical protein IFM89_035453 [Coptis chinensis]
MSSLKLIGGHQSKTHNSQAGPNYSIVNRSDCGESLAGQRIKIGGWVKTGREQRKGTFAFLEVNYGSCPTTLQVIVNSYDISLSTLVPTGTCVYVEGVLMKTPQGTKQKVELKVEKVLHVGLFDSLLTRFPKLNSLLNGLEILSI